MPLAGSAEEADVTEASWDWLVGEILQRSVRSTPDRFLELAEGSIADRDIVRLSQAKQADALRVIAVEARGRLGDGSASPGRQVGFVVAVPQLLASSVGQHSVDVVLSFWEELLAPPGRRLGPEVLAAAEQALTQQLASEEQLLRWSAARGIALLPSVMAERFRAHEAVSNDRTLRNLAFPR
jgi:hypothetical protein